MPPPIHATPWVLAPLLSVGIAAVVLRHVWSQRAERGALALLALAAFSGWWALTQGLILTVGVLDAQVFLAKLQVLGIAGAPLAWFCFAFIYTGFGDRLRSPLALVAVVPAATVALAFTNHRHHLLWTSLEPWHGIGPGLTVEHGPWFTLNKWFAYALVLSATAVMAQHLVQSPRHRARLALVVLAPLIVLFPNAVYLSVLEPGSFLDLTPSGLALANAAMAWGLLRDGRLAAAPVARSLVVEEMQDAVVVLNRRGNIVDVNRAASEKLGLRAEGPVPVSLGTAWAARGGDAHRRTEPQRLDLAGPDGVRRTYEMSIASLGPRAGSGTTVLVLRDVTDRTRMEREIREAGEALRRANEELERQANTDALTGLANRRHFLAALDREIERSHRYGRPLSLVLLDLDHFKSVNDRFGHAAGDEVLRSAADTLREVSRDTDLAARIGGEELAFLLPETGSNGALILAERLREGIARTPQRSPGGSPFAVTTSLGVATLGGPIQDGEALLHAADMALYAAKDAGRDRVEVHAIHGAEGTAAG